MTRWAREYGSLLAAFHRFGRSRAAGAIYRRATCAPILAWVRSLALKPSRSNGPAVCSKRSATWKLISSISLKKAANVWGSSRSPVGQWRVLRTRAQETGEGPLLRLEVQEFLQERDAVVDSSQLQKVVNRNEKCAVGLYIPRDCSSHSLPFSSPKYFLAASAYSGTTPSMTSTLAVPLTSSTFGGYLSSSMVSATFAPLASAFTLGELGAEPRTTC